MSKLVVLWLGAASLLLGECIHLPEERHGTLEVVATDLLGRQVDTIEVELLSEEGRGEASVVSTPARVKYGNYRLRISAQGSASTWRDVRIFQPHTIVRAELVLGHIGCPPVPQSFGGKVEREHVKGELWVKAIPLRGIGGGEDRVSDAGYFLISGLEVSTYIVIVVRGEKVLHQQVARAGKDTSSLLIELNPTRRR